MTKELPSGTVTFLFTDIEGSTRLLQAVGDQAYGELEQAHRDLVREAVREHRGVELRTEGDSFFLAFAEASDAVAAAVAAQLALGEHPWPEGGRVPVRMGIHTGVAVPVAGNYTALAVNQAARICAAAHGGQVLVSAETAALLPPSFEYRSLGLHRLKDLAAAIELFQVGHPRMEAEFPPPRSLEQVSHNLPVQPTTFVGRRAEMRTLRGLVGKTRMLTLLGPGGTGKTRLAFQLAADVAGDFPGGVWVAELANITEASQVGVTLLAALGLREQPGGSATETLLQHLRTRVAMVVLDNCEHLVGESAAFASRVLADCPRVTVLATSREALRVPGEVTFPVPGLGLPEPSRSDAVRLFMTRAAEARPGLVMTPVETEAVATICTRLDGLPLAIELAAARTVSLAPGQILARLGNALELLNRGRRGASDRQATMRGAIEWSYQLLEPREAAVFRRLAAFAGGWGLEAAETVCAGEHVPAGEVLDVVESLVGKSLVIASHQPSEPVRYSMLETIRAFAAERLDAADETLPTADRQAAWCLELASGVRAVARGSAEAALAFDRLDAEHANLLAALDQLHRRGDPRELDLAALLTDFWYSRGHWRTGAEYLSRATLLEGAEAGLYCRATVALGTLLLALGDVEGARRRLTASDDLAGRLGDRGIEASCQAGLGTLALVTGDLSEARERFEAALRLAMEAGDRALEGSAQGNLGQVAFLLSEYPRARTHLAEALRVSGAAGNRQAEGRWVGLLGAVAMRTGAHQEARQCYERALQVARELGERSLESRWAGSLGQLAIEVGDFEGAGVRYEEALQLARSLGDRQSEGFCLGSLGEIRMQLGAPEVAQQDFQQARAIARDMGDRAVEREWVEGLAASAQALGNAGVATGYYRELVEIDAALGDRRALRGSTADLGLLEMSLGDLEAARRRFEAVVALSREDGSTVHEAYWTAKLGQLEGVAGNRAAAAAHFLAALQVAAATTDTSATVWVAELVAGYLETHADRVAASELAAWSARQREAQAMGPDREVAAADSLRRKLREKQPEGAFDRALERASSRDAVAVREVAVTALRELEVTGGAANPA